MVYIHDFCYCLDGKNCQEDGSKTGCITLLSTDNATTLSCAPLDNPIASFDDYDFTIPDTSAWFEAHPEPKPQHITTVNLYNHFKEEGLLDSDILPTTFSIKKVIRKNGPPPHRVSNRISSRIYGKKATKAESHKATYALTVHALKV